MMQEHWYIDGLESLELTHKLAFGVACCETLVPNYYMFQVREQWGKFQLIRQATDVIWSFIGRDNIDHQSLYRYQAEVQSAIPDTNDFGSILSSLALDASLSVLCAIEACIDGDSGQIAEISALAINTATMKYRVWQDPDPRPHLVQPSSYVAAIQSPLVIAEMNRQRSDVAVLTANASLADTLIGELREKSMAIGRRLSTQLQEILRQSYA